MTIYGQAVSHSRGARPAMNENMQQFNYREVSTLIAVTVLMVVVVDNQSALPRRALIV